MSAAAAGIPALFAGSPAGLTCTRDGPSGRTVAAIRRTPERIAMTTSTLNAKIEDFLAQKRIAVAGVSRDKSHHPVGNLIYDRLKKTGHEVFAVNPNMDAFEGARCYSDLRSIPGGVDGVVIITRPEITRQIVEQCREAGIPRVWMHQSIGTGTSVSREAVAYCDQHQISVIAGACPMMYGPGVDFGHACMRGLLKLFGKLPH
jgi:uncharacterized protein